MASFTNFATLSYNGRSIASNTVAGEILETLTAEKTAAAADYTAGGDVSYVVSLVNSGDTALTGLTLSDDLGAYEVGDTTVYPLAFRPGSLRYYVNGALQPAPQAVAGPPMAVTGLTVPAGGSALLIYEATVTEYAAPTADGQITNTATITGGGLVTPVTAVETLTAAETAQLGIHKVLSPVTVAPDGTLSYTFTLENRGNTAVAAADGAVLRDDFAPILTGLSVALDGTAWTEGVNYSYDAAQGAFATLPGQIAIPAAEFSQNAEGSWTVTPGTATLTVTGTIAATA